MAAIKIDTILNHLEQEGETFTFTGNKEEKINHFSTLFNYKEGTLTFVSSLNDFSDHKHLFTNKKIQLVIISPEEEIADCFKNTIQVDRPKSVFFSILDAFFNEDTRDETLTNNPDHYKQRSFISEQATIGENVKIGIGAIIEGNVMIGDNTVIHHNVVIRANTTIGKNCTILSGAVIGETGFNPLKDEQNKRKLVQHFGGVTIGDDVHIGDNTTISKGTIEDTVIKRGVKINKQAIIAHNVVIGEDTVITTPAFIGGSVQIGRRCHVAASSIRNQCRIGDDATLGLGAVVIEHVEAGETVIGVPARPMKREE